MVDAPKVHVHMTVSDLAKSREFYGKFLGAAPVKEKPGYIKFLPVFGPLNLALSEARPGDGRGHVDHMGIQVESKDIVLRELARVKAAGLPVREEFSIDCCHANQDKFLGGRPRRGGVGGLRPQPRSGGRLRLRHRRPARHPGQGAGAGQERLLLLAVVTW